MKKSLFLSILFSKCFTCFCQTEIVSIKLNECVHNYYSSYEESDYSLNTDTLYLKLFVADYNSHDDFCFVLSNDFDDWSETKKPMWYYIVDSVILVITSTPRNVEFVKRMKTPSLPDSLINKKIWLWSWQDHWHTRKYCIRNGECYPSN